MTLVFRRNKEEHCYWVPHRCGFCDQHRKWAE